MAYPGGFVGMFTLPLICLVKLGCLCQFIICLFDPFVNLNYLGWFDAYLVDGWPVLLVWSLVNLNYMGVIQCNLLDGWPILSVPIAHFLLLCLLWLCILHRSANLIWSVAWNMIILAGRRRINIQKVHAPPAHVFLDNLPNILSLLLVSLWLL